MQALKITQIRPDIWALDEVGKTVMYVVNGQDKAMLVDTGFGLSDLKGVVRDLCGEKKIAVVNSHAHPDHAFGNNQFDVVYAGRFDEPNLHAEMSEVQRNRIIDSYFEDFLNQGGSIEKWTPGPAPKVLPLQEGDVVDLGNYKFQVIEIPGHSMGSIALWEKNEGWLFTGDTMLNWQVWGQLQNSTSLVIYGQSVKKLQQIEDKLTAVFPAHWTKETAAPGMSPYEFSPRVITVYAQGIQDTIDGRLEWEDYPFGFGNGPKKMMKGTWFEIGGIAFDPNRIGK